MTTAAAEELTRQISFKNTIVPAGHYLARPLRLIRGYDRGSIRPDLMAGITVAVILLPQAIAFALIADLPPEMGLYAAVIGGLAGALWGSSDQLHTGPTNAISLLVFSSLASVAVVGSPEYIVAASMLALLVGLFQLALGLARLGVLVNFVSHSVIVGFATGAAVLIAVRQIKPLLGLEFEAESVVDLLSGVATNVTEANPATAAIGIGTIVFMIVARKINPRIPAALLAMVLASLVVYALDLVDRGVDVIGLLPSGFPPVSMPVFDWDLVSSLAAGVIAVGAIGLVEIVGDQQVDRRADTAAAGQQPGVCGPGHGQCARRLLLRLPGGRLILPLGGQFSRRRGNAGGRDLLQHLRPGGDAVHGPLRRLPAPFGPGRRAHRHRLPHD